MTLIIENNKKWEEELRKVYTKGFVISEGTNYLSFTREEEIPNNAINYYIYDIEKAVAYIEDSLEDTESARDYVSVIY